MLPRSRNILAIASGLVIGATAITAQEEGISGGDCNYCEEGATTHFFLIACGSEMYAGNHTDSKMGGCSNSHFGC
jgi:hypothetical protein